MALRAALCAIGTLCLSTSALMAQDLTIGSKLEPNTLDPHFRNAGENHSHLPGMMEYLVWRDQDLVVQPHLISSWEQVDPVTWTFVVRDGVLFHDGTPMTASDFAFVIARVPTIVDSPGDFSGFVEDIERVEITGDLTFTLHLSRPVADLPRDLSALMMISEEVGLDVATRAFDTGAAVIGTGPYRLEAFVPGQHLIMSRFEDYWGGLPDWARVTILPISSDPTRVAALLSGEVDLIDFVPLDDAARLRQDPDIRVFEREESRLMFVAMDSVRDRTPHVWGLDGAALDVNPLQDPRVRTALSLAIDRDLLIDRVLQGAGTPAAQALPPEIECSNQTLSVTAPDPERARALLAEAGYPDGFGLTLHGPSDRYPGGERVVQALAQMWSRIGLDIEVETVTRNVFFPAAADNDYSVYFAGYGATTVLNVLNMIAHTNDREVNRGAANRGRYSNPEVDALIVEASATLDAEQRCALLSRVNEIVFSEDMGIIPLYHPLNIWAARADANVTFEPNAEGLTWIHGASLSPN